MTTLWPFGRLALATCGAAALAGCMNMSGLSGGSSYGCKAPEGVRCRPVSGTYSDTIQNNPPIQPGRGDAGSSPDTALPQYVPMRAAQLAPVSPASTVTPLRSSARILRLWFKPWEDADRDLYDQGYVYVQVDNGQWLVEHAQRQIRDAYAPLRAPPRTAAPVGDTKGGPMLPANLTSAPRPSDAVNPLQGLTASRDRPESTD